MTLLPLLCLALAGVQDAPLVRSTFADGTDGWIAAQPLGSGGAVSAVHDPENLKVGPGSLRLAYSVGAGQLAGAALPFAEGALTKMGSIHFWIRSDRDAPLVAVLQEKGGGRFSATFSAGKDRWQEVELGLSDFVLNAGGQDPDDANGRLDRDRIESFSIIDLDQLLAQNAGAAGVLGIPTGPRALLVSDFQAIAKPLPDPVVGAGGEVVLDAFARPQPAWAAFDAAASVVSEAPFSSPALRLDYNLASGKAAIAFRGLPLGALAGKGSLTLRLAAKNACRVVVELEEKGGGKYNAMLDVPAGSDPVDRVVPFNGIAAADDSKDANGHFDADQVDRITLMDVTAMTGAPGGNTLWVGKVAAKP